MKEREMGLVSQNLSFFKVMFGEDFSKVLFLPPKYAINLRKLVDEKFQLEDINKQIWIVTLSIVDGALAFHKGWTSFSKDHNLKIGDFLIFDMTRAFHFVIRVYDQTGCCKLNFSTNYSQRIRKRTRITQTPVDKHIHQSHITDGTSSNDHNSRSVFTPSSTGMNQANVIIPVLTNTVSASGSKFSEEAVYMLNRDVSYNTEDDGQRISLFDLSSFERQTNRQGISDIPVKTCRKEFIAEKTSSDAIPAIVEVPNNLKNPENPSMENGIENVCPVVPVPVRNEPVVDLGQKGQEEDAGRKETLAEEEGRVIYLRGFDKKLWPVIYKSSNSMGNGWDAFMEANNIGANDFYIFKSEINTDPENATTSIYTVCRS